MIQACPLHEWAGRTIARVEVLGTGGRDTIFHARGLRFTFVDGRVMVLRAEIFQDEPTISEYAVSASYEEVADAPVDGV